MNRVLKSIGAIFLIMSGATCALAASGGRVEVRETPRTSLFQRFIFDSNSSRNDRQMPRDHDRSQNDAWQDTSGYGLAKDNGTQNSNTDNGRKQGKLSPEERKALRRQIDEAGHDIYTQRR